MYNEIEQRVESRYTAEGFLKSIGVRTDIDAAVTGNGVLLRHIFSEQMNYYNGDYRHNSYSIPYYTSPSGSLPENAIDDGDCGSGSSLGLEEDFTGNIVFNSSKLRTSEEENLRSERYKLHTNVYQYDDNYQLKKGASIAEYTYNGSTCWYDRSNPDHQQYIAQSTRVVNQAEGSYGGEYLYNDNGNITELKRQQYDELAANVYSEQDHWLYTYNEIYPGIRNNQLQKVENVNTNAAILKKEYTYDEVGRMTEQKITLNGGSVNTAYYQYNDLGLIKGVYNDELLTDPLFTYEYNEMGLRSKETSYGASTLKTYYFYSSFGKLLAIYEKEEANGDVLVQREVPLYGLMRMGIFHRKDESRTYEFKDHLGSVRAVAQYDVVNKQYRLTQGMNYYPFGSQINEPYASTDGLVGSFDHRYGYQGEYAEDETDETGFNGFEARAYDAIIGRWMSADPHHQFYSSYLGMGNDPINGFDVDGRDVILLNYPEGAGKLGHMAMLVGDDTNGWVYVSKEGTKSLGGLYGKGNELTIKGLKLARQAQSNKEYRFSSVEDFVVSEFNRDKSGGRHYSSGIYFETDLETDGKIIEKGLDIVSKKYDVFSSSCISACVIPLANEGIIDSWYEDGTFPNYTYWKIFDDHFNDIYNFSIFTNPINSTNFTLYYKPSDAWAPKSTSPFY